jgi:O-antigen ligase
MVLVAGTYTFMNYENRFAQEGGAFDAYSYRWLYSEAPIVNFFVVPSAAAAATLPVVPLALWYMRYGLKYRLVLPVFAVVACLPISLYSFSRGAWLAAIAVLGASLLVLLPRMRTKTALALLLLCAIAVFVGLDRQISPVLQSRLGESGLQTDANTDVRLANYALALKSGLSYPVIGVGMGNYPAIYREFPESTASHYPQLWFAHNLFLTLIPEIGFLGAMVFALLFATHIISPFWRRKGTFREAEFERCAAVGMLGLVIVASATGCHLVSHLRTNTYWTYFCAPVMIVAFTLLGTLAGLPEGRTYRARGEGSFT